MPFFYFHHIIDGENALLTVEVIGPNLSFTFSHRRARGVRGTGSIAVRLERKATGFLALVKGEERHVLALAESGHGSGPMGDLLDAPLDSPILPNDVWARRTARIGNLIGCLMNSPFDTGRQSGHTIVTSIVNGNPTTLREEMKGMFFGCHVEVKLAVYAVCAMLKEFGITTDFDNLTITQLRKLRRVKWEDGTRPAFEVFFSRKNCARCGKLAETLEKVTGLKISLCWKERLVKKVYNRPTVRKPAPKGRHAIPAATASGEVIDIEDDDDDDELGAPSSASMTDDNTVDLTSEIDERRRSPIDLTEADAMLLHNPLFFPGTRPGEGEDDDNDDDDDDAPSHLPYRDGSERRRATQLEAQATASNKSISKPLPGTPVTDSPKAIPNTAERTAFNRFNGRNPFAAREISLDPRALRNPYSTSTPSRSKRRLSPNLRERHFSQKRRRLGLGKSIPERKRYPYSVAPILTDPAEESSSSDDSIPKIGFAQAVREKNRQSRPSVEAAASNMEDSNGSDIPRRLFPQRGRPVMLYPLKISSTRSLERVGNDDPVEIPNASPLTQQITPPKTPSQAGKRSVTGRELESPTPQMHGRELTSSPDPF